MKKLLPKAYLFCSSLMLALGMTELLWFRQPFWFGYFLGFAIINGGFWWWLK